MYVCIFIKLQYVCMHVCMYVCMYVCVVAAGRCNGHYLCWSVRSLGFHSVIRMLTQGIGFCGSRLVLIELGWRAVKVDDRKRSIDQCLTSQRLKMLV